MLKRVLIANRGEIALRVLRARKLAKGVGLVAVNAMVATTQYADSVRTALRAGADAIVCGAGLPKDLPAIAAEVPESDAALAPIVSGGRAASLICRLWDRHYGRVPDFVVLEGPLAGGHLGFSREEALAAQAGAPKSLSGLLWEVLDALAPFKEKYGRDIPVFAAGGVKDGAEMRRCMKEGAAGAVEAIFTALSLRDGFLPATIHYRTPDPACDLDIVANEGRKADIRYAMSNSLGFGGHNGSLLLKKWEA